MLQRFLPVFAMTFFICLFIVLMQFLWKSIDDLVGKGLTVDVIAELFFYAALTMVPMALPLAVLLASLMTFGNLGEKFELTAMKSSGISLFKIMRPLIILMVFIAIGAFFFQNNVLPIAQTKMWTMLFSVRQKSPEVEIPEKSFYDQIPNMNLYVEHKNAETGMLYGMIIYDLTRGIDNSRVILADSGKFNFTEDKTRLFLHLYSGEMFENMKDNTMGGITSSQYMPFRRENFTDKQIYFPFDMNFNRMDEQGMRSQYIGQNVSELRMSIDSISARVDSFGQVYASDLLSTPFVGVSPEVNELRDGDVVKVRRREVAIVEPIDIDSVFLGRTPAQARSYVAQALSKAKRRKQDFEFKSVTLTEQAKLMRRHEIELQKKFTLSFACIIFFFIGAPLGAIIKKGGIGTPLVISVILFIIYYIIDNMGYKMARDGKMAVWEGIWLSSAVLMPLGVFFTYKAVGDSGVFNLDAYRAFFLRLTGRREARTLELKEVRMNDVVVSDAIGRLHAFKNLCEESADALRRRPAVLRLFAGHVCSRLRPQLDQLVDYLSNSDDNIVINLLNKYPFEPTRRNIVKIIGVTDELLARFGGSENSTDYGQ